MIKYLKSEKDFLNLINSRKVLVDFYADWCGPCQALGKILEDIDFIDILKINVDEFPAIAKDYGIMSIPTLCYFNNGELKLRKIGLQSLEDIKNTVNQI